MSINDKIENRMKYVEMKQEVANRKHRYIEDVMGMQDEYYHIQRCITDVSHLIEFSDELSVKDKMNLFDLLEKLLKDRRVIKDFIGVSVRHDVKKPFFSTPSRRYTREDILENCDRTVPEYRKYALRSGDDRVISFINNLKFKDKKYPNVETEVSDEVLKELKSKFN